MMIPPVFVRIRLIEDGGRRIRLWLPVIILWPLAVVVAVIFVPVAAVAAIVSLGSRSVRKALRKICRIVVVVFSLRGLLIQVKDDKDEVLINVS
jgi:hypothetical protein